MRTGLAVSLSASLVIGAAFLAAGCGGSSPPTTQQNTAERGATASTPTREAASNRHCSGRWVESDRVVVNFSNASSYRLDVEVSQKKTTDRNDRFTLAPKSAPATVRCSGGMGHGKDLVALVEWNERYQYEAWKNAATGSDVVYCCDIRYPESRKLHEPGDSTSFGTWAGGKPAPFTTTMTLESVRGGIPHFDVTYTDR
jgi:hypothetical protein